MAQEQIGTGPLAPTPVPDPSGSNSQAISQIPPYTSQVTPPPRKYDPATYNQWDPENPETLYPAPGPAPVPPLGPCDQRTGYGQWCPKNWYVKQDVRVMYHPTARGPIYSMIYDPHLNRIGTTTVLFYNEAKSGSLKMEPSAGYDITIGKYLGRDSDNRDQFIEFNYYGLNYWKSRFPVNSTNNLTLTDSNDTPTITTTSGNLFSMFGGDQSAYSDVSGFNRADSHRLEYDSRWDNFELNLRIKPRDRADRLLMHKNAMWTREAQEGWVCSYLFGARGVSLDEYFAFLSSGTIEVTQREGVAVPYTAEVGGYYLARTRNDMFGLQIGMDCIHQKGPWKFGADIKTGVFINFADQHTRARSWGAATATGGDPWATTDVGFQTLVRSRDIASIAELGFMTSYQIRRNMTFNVSYDLSWIHGLALAPEQFIAEANAPARINHNGRLLMQSLSMGLEIVW